MIVEQIRALCKKNGITLAQLEKELKFGNGTIRRWNYNPPSIMKVLDVSKYFNITIDDLIDRDNYKN